MFQATPIALATLIGFAFASVSSAGSLELRSRSGVAEAVLNGPEAGQQLIVMSGGRDVTREVVYSVTPPVVAAVDASGWVTPLSDGRATITATMPDNTAGSLVLKVENFGHLLPVSFTNDVMPVLTRNHCNSGACHAKASGNNGFQLSLLGFDPLRDHEMLTVKGRGRRISIAAPDSSLLLQKPSGEIPHQGGARLEKNSDDYRTLRRWIEAGALMASDKDPVVDRIEVYPAHAVAAPGSSQQLAVTAYFNDGTSRDITRMAQYVVNQPDMAEAGETGLIRFDEKSGITSVMVRFQQWIGVFSATIPVGAGLDLAKFPGSANFIDTEIFKQLGVLGLSASPAADDGIFLRRATLDVTGRLPTLEETRTFLGSSDPNKRAILIDTLLETPNYADFFAGKWAGLLRNKVAGGTEWVSRDSQAFHAWIRSAFIQNKPFDQFASELITASGKANENPAVSWYRVVTDRKEQMQDIAQVFLGVRMQCAQCHHHPYERWTQDDYYSFAALFSTIERKKIGKLPEEDIVYHNRKAAQMENPNSKVVLQARLLGAEQPLGLPDAQDPRPALADWMRDPANPYFSKVLVNRYWKHFFGRGLVEPEDDIRPTNPPTHPELLDRLAAHFVQSGYDMKALIRVITNSRAYQLSAEPVGQNADDTQNYARFYPRRMSAEVMLDAANDLSGAQNSFNRQPMGVRAVALPNEEANNESEFLTMFGRPQMDTACECERTTDANLGQSLHLINSDLIQAKLALSAGRASLLAKEKERPDVDRLQEVYLTALCRKPADEESAVALAHLKRKRELSAADPAKLSPAKAEQEAWEDILWVVMNSKEFLFNH